MSLTDDLCKSSDLREEEKKLCYEFASNILDLLADLEKKGYLRSELKLKKGEEEKKKFINVIWNVREVTHAFNMFFDMYAEKVKPDSKQRLKKFLELNKPYGMTEEDLRYLLYSEMIFVFLLNAEEFRSALLFTMKLDKDEYVNEKTTLGTLLWRLRDLGINKSEALDDIDYELRNGLSHGLFWFHEKADEHHSKPHLHYSKDLTFMNTDWIDIAELYVKTRRQSLYTNCLLNVIGDWFI